MLNKNIKAWLDKPFQVYQAETFPEKTNPITYFALTDSLIKYAGEFDQPVLYFWPTRKIIFLGMIDTKLPHLDESLQIFNESDYDFIVRNSGGLAVVSDPGILNFSMIFPESDDRLTINEAYERMHDLISESFKSLGLSIIADEVPDSYCPGDYDLSIGGKKIAGISQRRVSGGISIMIYVAINGNQLDRTQLIKDFYDQGLQGEEVHWHYPDINTDVMTTLSEASGKDLTVDWAIQQIIKTIEHHQEDQNLELGDYNPFIMDNYYEAYEKMISRNSKLLADNFDEEEYTHE